MTRIVQCPASAYPAAIDIEPPAGESARLGSAVHESQQILIETGAEADVMALAQKCRVDEGELGYLCYAARKAWLAVADLFPRPTCEQYFSWLDAESQIELTGHPDVYDISADALVIADWKSGFLWSDCAEQLKTYAWLIAQRWPVKQMTGLHLSLRRGEIERFDWEYDELAEWWQGVAARIKDGRERYGPSYDGCKYCPRFHECPAGRRMAESALLAIAGDEDMVYSDVTAAVAYERARFVAKLAEDALEKIRTLVAQAGGEWTMTDGDKLLLRREKRDKIDAEAGWVPMTTALPMGDVLGACTVGKTKLLDAVRALAPRGAKKAAADELMQRLKDAGAVSETFIEKLDLRKAPAKRAI